jgi:predicted sugar kinase
MATVVETVTLSTVVVMLAVPALVEENVEVAWPLVRAVNEGLRVPLVAV